MTNLFVDCDDTLEFYWCDDAQCDGTHPYGSVTGNRGCPNYRLIHEINKWRKHNPKALLVVWSGGGSWYARRFATRYFPKENKLLLCLDKFGSQLDLPEENDIVIDDMEISVACPVMDPRKWVYENV